MRSLVVVAVFALPAIAIADTPKEHFTRAQDADKAGRYEEAIPEYEEAYKLSPHPDVLFNIAVDYEHLKDWAKAADYFQRYLTERDTPAQDADAVERRIRRLRARVAKQQPTEPPPTEPPPTEPPPPGVTNPPVPGVGIDQPMPPPVPVELPWHVGASYGVGVGGTPSERYLVHGGYRFAGHLETDAIVGAFGHNDYAVGVMARVVFSRAIWSPFIRGGATIGFAKQDSSSSAGTKLPFGFEAGGGVQVGKRGRVEIAAVLRFLQGGWDDSSTTSPGYINDSFTVGIDLGVALDIPTNLSAIGR